MEYKEFLTKVGNTMLKYAEMPEGAEVTAEASADVMSLEEAAKAVNKSITQTVNFDGNGDWTYSTSVYCPFNIDASGQITESSSSSAVFDIYINTNYSQNFEDHNIKVGDTIQHTIKTNVFSNTKISIKIHSSVANSTATFKLDCNI